MVAVSLNCVVVPYTPRKDKVYFVDGLQVLINTDHIIT